MVVATTISAGIELLSDLGVRQSIIRSNNSHDVEFRRTAWVIQIARGAFLSLVCLVLAGVVLAAQRLVWVPMASVYGHPGLAVTLVLLSISVLLRGFVSIDVSMAVRTLHFGKVMAFQLIRDVATVVSVIVWALIDPSIWALAGGPVAGMAVSLIMSHVMFASKANRIGWNKGAAAELLAFGKWIILSSWLGFVASYGGRLLLGFFLNSADMGCFAIALAFVEAIRSSFQKLQSLWYSAISEIARERPSQLSSTYYRIRRYQDPAIFFVAGFLISSGERIIAVLYDARYLEAGWMLRVLGASLIFVAYAVKPSVVLAMGQPRALWQASFAIALAIMIGLPVAYIIFDAVGAVAWLSFSPIFGLPAVFLFFSRRSFLNFPQEVKYLPVAILGFVAGYSLEAFPWSG